MVPEKLCNMPVGPSCVGADPVPSPGCDGRRNAGVLADRVSPFDLPPSRGVAAAVSDARGYARVNSPGSQLGRTRRCRSRIAGGRWPGLSSVFCPIP